MSSMLIRFSCCAACSLIAFHPAATLVAQENNGPKDTKPLQGTFREYSEAEKRFWLEDDAKLPVSNIFNFSYQYTPVRENEIPGHVEIIGKLVKSSSGFTEWQLSINGTTWALDFQGQPDLLAKAAQLSGKWVGISAETYRRIEPPPIPGMDSLHFRWKMRWPTSPRTPPVESPLLLIVKSIQAGEK